MAQMDEDFDKISMEVASSNITAEKFARFQSMTAQEQVTENMVS